MIRSLAVVLALATPTLGHAHSFGEPYRLPMPYWMYIYGAMAALALSFVVMGFFLTRADAQIKPPQYAFGDSLLARALHALRMPLLVLSSTAMLLAIVTGLGGTIDPYRNFNMTYFWIVFALGMLYASSLLGDVYAAISPWRGLSMLFRGGTLAQGRIRYPAEQLAYWPAVVLYMSFIALELLGRTRPFSLSLILLAYSALNLFAIWLIGARAWFRYGEFFALMFRLAAQLAPLAYAPDQSGAQRLRLRWPLSGLLHQRVEHLSLLVFILFMLSSTAYDGLRETSLWFSLFWKDPFGWITPWLGQPPIYAYVALRPWFVAYELVWLIASPFIYLGLFLLFLWLGRLVTRSTLPLSDLALRFGYSLLPIALVYHATHYYTLLLNQGVKIRALISDPFGWGWNLFGSAISGRVPIIPDMGVVWNTQVWLILIGHVASVYLAHAEALRSFPSRTQATLSQIPMLLLMVLFTGIGLWILAQPLQG